MSSVPLIFFSFYSCFLFSDPRTSVSRATLNIKALFKKNNNPRSHLVCIYEGYFENLIPKLSSYTVTDWSLWLAPLPANTLTSNLWQRLNRQLNGRRPRSLPEHVSMWILRQSQPLVRVTGLFLASFHRTSGLTAQVQEAGGSYFLLAPSQPSISLSWHIRRTN